jgi:IS30 family transposase
MPTYSRLTHEQRFTIEAMKRNGSPQNETADGIGKHPSTVSRELRWLGVCRGYCS